MILIAFSKVYNQAHIFEGYEEAIYVEYLLKLYHMRKAKSQKITTAQVVDPMTKDIKPDINQQDQEKREVTAKSDKTRCETLDTNEISALFKDYSEFLSSNKFDQQVQVEKEDDVSSEELEMVNKPTDHLMEPL